MTLKHPRHVSSSYADSFLTFFYAYVLLSCGVSAFYHMASERHSQNYQIKTLYPTTFTSMLTQCRQELTSVSHPLRNWSRHPKAELIYPIGNFQSAYPKQKTVSCYFHFLVLVGSKFIFGLTRNNQSKISVYQI